MAWFLSGCAGTPVPPEVGIKNPGKIPVAAPPPDSPNCISSYVSPEEDSRHGALPIGRSGKDAAEAQNTIRNILQSEERMEILGDIPGYIHVVHYSALWKFPDDVEFWFPEGQDVIHFRSASRLGYGDLGVNRKRMERIRGLYR